MSGSGRVVEIGVISLGTSTQDGTKREVRELKSQSLDQELFRES
jgi:hypothetical protein